MLFELKLISGYSKSFEKYLPIFNWILKNGFIQLKLINSTDAQIQVIIKELYDLENVEILFKKINISSFEDLKELNNLITFLKNLYE